MKDIIKYITNFMRETADKLDAGNSNITEQQAINVFQLLGDEVMSKDQVMQYLNIDNNQFYKLQKEGKIPKGKKVRGFKELQYYKSELLKLDILA